MYLELMYLELLTVNNLGLFTWDCYLSYLGLLTWVLIEFLMNLELVDSTS